MADRFKVFPEILDRFASDPIDPLGSVPRAIADETDPAHALLQVQLLAIDAEAVATEMLDPTFRFLHKGATGEGLERAARVWALIKCLESTISENRLALLRKQDEFERPLPYEEPSLSDLSVRADRLVPLSAFEVDGGTLSRNGHAFMIAPTVDGQNASHWLTLVLGTIAPETAHVRLDPFLHGPADTFSRLFYKMWWYGRPLDWTRLSELRQDEHGRWHHDDRRKGADFSDFVWSRRGQELHFRCEEVPTIDAHDRRGARYLHAIYDTDRDVIAHVDGAVRLYESVELADRQHTHVRSAGKAGVRVKLFRIDAPLPKEALTDICTAFFMWNDDVKQYFAGES